MIDMVPSGVSAQTNPPKCGSIGYQWNDCPRYFSRARWRRSSWRLLLIRGIC